MQSNSEMLLSERRARLLGAAAGIREDLMRRDDIPADQRREALERAERWEREAQE